MRRKFIAFLVSTSLASGLSCGLAWPALADPRAAAGYSAARGGVSFLAMRAGAVVLEDYPNGGAPGKAHELASGTKSFSCVIAAAAVQDGLLDLDETGAETLAEWRDDPQKSTITIRQILNLTSGVHSDGVGRPPSYAEAVAEEMATAPGTAFEYGPVNFQIFGEIMRRKLRSFEGGRYADAVAYLEARVFEPAGVAAAQWNAKAGEPTLPSGADMTARDWARFGEFVRVGGVADGRARVDAAALAECFIGSSANPAYGLSWWLNEDPGRQALAASRTMTVASDLFTHPRRGALPDDLVMAAGAGGQRLYIIPSLETVIVRQNPRLFERRRGPRAKPFSDVEFLLAYLDEG